MRASIIVLSMSGALLLLPRPARSCGPTAPPPSPPPCSFVQLYLPADRFPAQLERAIRIGTFDEVGGALAPQTTFDPNTQIFVHRMTSAGYEPVAFQLVQEAGLVPNALHLQLADPAPGQYIVSSPQMTCAADPSSTGTGQIVGSFELEPAAALPTRLGALHWAGEHTEEQTLSVGEDGACRSIDVTTQVAHSELEVQLADDALPWGQALEASIWVDGMLYRGSAPLLPQNGVATIDLTRICSSSNPIQVPAEPGFDGFHTVKLVGHLEGFPDIESTETQFSLSCDPGLFGGCAVGGEAHSSLVPLLAASLAFVMRRRKKA